MRREGGEALGRGLGLDLGHSGVALVLRQPHLLTQAHPQIGYVLKIQIHVEGVGSSCLIVTEELLHHRRWLSVGLMLIS